MKILKHLLTLCVLMVCLADFAMAQYTVKGKVVDEQGEALPGINIVVKGTTNGIISDIDGEYQLSGLKQGTVTIVCSFIGYKSQEFTLKLDSIKVVTKDITMKEDDHEIEECVVIGYGTQKSGRSRKIKDRGKSNDANYAISFDAQPVNFNTEKYDAKNENAFKDTKTDPISVFSSDVDNASYSNVRRFINNSQMPTEGAVRIEEMINYFSYNYPQPTEDKPINIYTELGECCWNPDHELLQIGIKAKDIDIDKTPSSNLVFLIDVSGSMYDDNKLPLLVKSFKIMTEGLRDKDYVSIVTYAGSNEVKLKPTQCDQKGKKEICETLDGLCSGGSTAGFNAIEKAYQLAKENFIKDGNNRVLLATDGDFNVGESSNSALEKLIKEEANTGIYLTVLGFGMGNYNDSMMEKISNAGNGNYYYIDNISEANKALGEGLWGTLYTVAKDVKILVDFNPNIVKSYRLIGYEDRLLNNEDFEDDKKDAGDMGAGHTVTALYELVTDKSKEQADIKTVKSEYTKTETVNDFTNYLTVKFRYKNPNDTVSQLIEKHVTKNDKPEKPSDNFVLAENVALFGQLLSNSKFTKKESYKTLLENLKPIPSDDKGYIDELKVLVRKANDLK